MNRVAQLDDQERGQLIQEAAVRLRVQPVIVEKDFWVCWMLERLFERREWADALVFKGGTALSKVFGAIRRFSEDIDLSVSPATVGVSEDDLSDDSSRNQIGRWMEKAEASCGDWVKDVLLPDLTQSVAEVIGVEGSLRYETDVVSQSPVLQFSYPTVLVTDDLPYIQRTVKLEFGSLTDQRPIGGHRIQPWLVAVLPATFRGMGTEVTALEIERAFWEKATILHAEYHRAEENEIPTRYSRHYSDVAALARCDDIQSILNDGELRERVVNWKSRFFARTWARYDLAKPGTFRLVPPESRFKELESDYAKMREMFMDEPPPFSEVMTTLESLERQINLKTKQ